MKIDKVPMITTKTADEWAIIISEEKGSYIPLSFFQQMFNAMITILLIISAFNFGQLYAEDYVKMAAYMTDRHCIAENSGNHLIWNCENNTKGYIGYVPFLGIPETYENITID